MELTDAAAVEKALSGDDEGFRLLVERHSRSIFRLSYRMTGNEHDAEDVVQETLLRAYRHLRRYDARSSFSTWLYSIASNCALDLLRARKRREDRHSDSSEGELDTMSGDQPNPERMLMSHQVSESIESAMARLTSKERAAFVLRHFEGLSTEEIGKSLGMQANAAKHTVFRAVRKLRQAL